MIRTFAFVAILAFVLASAAFAQVPNELRATMQSRDSAVAKADVATWDRLTAETFTVVQVDGIMMTKAERIAQMKTQKPSPLVAHQREQINRYGDVFVRRFLAGDIWVLYRCVGQGVRWMARCCSAGHDRQEVVLPGATQRVAQVGEIKRLRGV